MKDGRERGSTMVEAAFVVPLFLLLVFGILHAGLLLRDWQAIANITSDAGRAASTHGNDVRADFEIIQDVERAASVIGTSRITRVVIFRASGPDTPVPTGCKNGTATSVGANPCNVYPTAAFADNDPAHFDCSPGAAFSSAHWCPTTRRVAVRGTGGPPDYIGIYVQIRHRPIAGIFGQERTIERTSIFRLEPQVLDG